MNFSVEIYESHRGRGIEPACVSRKLKINKIRQGCVTFYMDECRDAVAEEGVPVRGIAEAIGCGLKVPVVSKSPEEAAAHFGWLGVFVGRDLTGSSVETQRRLGLRLNGSRTFISTLEEGQYDTVATEVFGSGTSDRNKPRN